MCVRVDVRLTSDIGSSDLTFGWSPDAINECDIIIRQHALAPAHKLNSAPPLMMTQQRNAKQLLPLVERI